MEKMKVLPKGLIVVLLSVIVISFMSNVVNAESNGLTLEKSYEWVTGDYSYAMGVTSADIDNDDKTEIITVGYYHNSTVTPPSKEGELDIWTWNGTDLTLEHSEHYEITYTWSSDTRFYDVAVGNLNNDTETEIVTVGFGSILGIEEYGLIVVGSWNGSFFNRKALTYFPEEIRETKAFGVALGDVDKDDVTEIVVVGYTNSTVMGAGFHGQITIWNMTGKKLNLETSQEWRSVGDTVWRSVAISDVDLDGDDEIIVVGDFDDPVRNVRCAELKICSWDGKIFKWEASRQWYTYSDTYCQEVVVGNLDSEGIPDIVTIGHQMGSERFYTQLRIWNWKDEILTLKFSAEGGSADLFLTNFGTAVAVGDVDNDKINEIVAGIQVSAIFVSTATMRIFAWDGQTLINEGRADWTNSSVIESVTCLDVDDDDAVEIITAGYTEGMMVTPKSTLGIWSVSKVGSRLSVELSSDEITLGDQVVINGQLVNETGNVPIPNAEVRIEFEHENESFQLLTTVKTDENGRFSYGWIPLEVGQYTIKVSWTGDFQHESALNTTTLTVNKIQSMITISLSNYTTTVGTQIIVTGTLYPAQEANITLEYVFPNGTTTRTVNANAEGKFSDNFIVDQAGTWQITASWNGNEKYEGATSNAATVTVQAPQAPDIMSQILTMAGLVFGLIALIIAIAAAYMVSRKKTATPL